MKNEITRLYFDVPFRFDSILFFSLEHYNWLQSVKWTNSIEAEFDADDDLLCPGSFLSFLRMLIRNIWWDDYVRFSTSFQLRLFGWFSVCDSTLLLCNGRQCHRIALTTTLILLRLSLTLIIYVMHYIVLTTTMMTMTTNAGLLLW